MKKTKIAIVENEEVMANDLKELCLRFSSEEHLTFDISTFSNGYDFLELSSDFDLIFMDIDMPGINGMEVSKKLRKGGNNAVIIFTTNLPQYAIDGYKVGAKDFLLKPITYPDFYLSLSHLKNLFTDEEFLLLNLQKQNIKIRYRDIEYIELVKHDVVIHRIDSTSISFRGSIKMIEGELDMKQFFKANSGVIINIEHIESVDSSSLITESKKIIPISRSHRKEVLERINEYYKPHRSKDA